MLNIEQTRGEWGQHPPTFMECALVDALLRSAYEGRTVECQLLQSSIGRLFAPVQKRRSQ